MPTLDVYDENSQKVGQIEVSEAVFAAEPKPHLLHEVVTWQLACRRAGTASTKTRSEVRGGGRKPWRQKGTGRARAGTRRSPLWRGGGKTFAARPQDHSQKVNKKMYRGAMRSILSELVRQDRLLLVDALELPAPKTKELVARLKAMGLDEVLIVTHALDDALYLAARNLPKVTVRSVDGVDPVSLVGAEKVLMTAEAAKILGERLA